ncbi:hypothetical protein [Zwartia vadi]|uniref:hypothetical protein n=1 Tax=Zwartia vadi TaxID=3058168 RepID=UPI0025B44E69|nr:hypothetical protein [Zwartia vadi]MDN3988408.1 hypothetical protein [Zwartia vadi]
MKFPNKYNGDMFASIWIVRLRMPVVIVLTALWIQSAEANETRSSEPNVVQELLQLDTQAALLAARKNVVGNLSQPGPVTHLVTENILLAIYGVGQSLTAEVLLDAEPHVFKNRQVKPVTGRSVQYTLERIAPPCIHLKKLETPEVLCLGQVRP